MRTHEFVQGSECEAMASPGIDTPREVGRIMFAPECQASAWPASAWPGMSGVVRSVAAGDPSSLLRDATWCLLASVK